MGYVLGDEFLVVVQLGNEKGWQERLWDDVQCTVFHCSQGFDSCTLYRLSIPLPGLGHQRGHGVSSESAYTLNPVGLSFAKYLSRIGLYI